MQIARESIVSFEQCHDSVAIIDRSGTILAVNPAWDAFSAKNGGPEKNAFLETNYLQICQNAEGEDREIALRAETALREILEKRRQHFEIVYPCHSPEERRWFRCRAYPMELKGELYCIVQHENVTARILTEEDLAQTLARWRALLNEAPFLILVVDRDGSIRTVNSPSCFSEKTIKSNNNLFDIFTLQKADQSFKQSLHQVYDSGGSEVLDADTRIAGETLHLEIHFRAFDVHGFREVLVVVINKTEKTRMNQRLVENQKKLAALNQHLDTFHEEEMRYVSRELHDILGDYLTALKIDIAVIRKKAEGHADYEELAELASKSEDLLQEVMDRSRLFVRTLRLNVPEEATFIDAIKKKVKKLQSLKNIEVTLAIHGLEKIQLPRQIQLELYRIVQEGLTNVQKHAGASAVDINISVSGDNELVIDISDNGRGIAARQQRRGTLGLTSIRERVEALKGYAELQNRTEGGAQLRVIIPDIKGFNNAH